MGLREFSAALRADHSGIGSSANYLGLAMTHLAHKVDGVVIYLDLGRSCVHILVVDIDIEVFFNLCY